MESDLPTQGVHDHYEIPKRIVFICGHSSVGFGHTRQTARRVVAIPGGVIQRVRDGDQLTGFVLLLSLTRRGGDIRQLPLFVIAESNLITGCIGDAREA